MPEKFDGAGPDPANKKDPGKAAPQKRDRRGGSRKGAGKPSLGSKNMVPIMVKLSLLETDWEAINTYTDLRENTKFRVDILRDIISFVTHKLENSGLSNKEQAEATRDLDQFFREHFREEDEK